MATEAIKSGNPKFTVTFEYDAAARKWDVIVRGAESERDAVQGFNAVLLTAQQATPSLECNRATLVETEANADPDIATHTYRISVGQ